MLRISTVANRVQTRPLPPYALRYRFVGSCARCLTITAKELLV